MKRILLLSIGFFVSVCQAQGPFGGNLQGGNQQGGNQLGVGDQGGGVAGGSSFADFDSLIDLIQTTVVPDTWDALGGPSTIGEYAQGVYVDPAGTLKPLEATAPSNSLANLNTTLLVDSDRDTDRPANWLAPSALRCVSLGRLHDHWMAHRQLSKDPSEAMVHLAGLSRVDYVVFSDNDIVIAGPVGGIESHQGWVRDRKSGMAAIRLDFLATTLAAARTHTSFGCTIDPTTEGLQNAATVAAKIQSKSLPIGKAAGELAGAIGMQRIEIFGTPAGTPIGLMMVEADRHMKQLALGVHPMPRIASNYLDAIDAAIADGPPNDLLLRLWFTANACQVDTDPDHNVFHISGTPVRLSGQNERALASGERGHVVVDPRTETFVKDFNANWAEIRAAYPIYAGLQSIYQSAAIAAITQRHENSPWHDRLLDSFAALASQQAYEVPVAKQVETIAVLHRSRIGRKRHSILIASGGVAVNPVRTVSVKMETDPSLKSYRNIPTKRPEEIGKWWWEN